MTKPQAARETLRPDPLTPMSEAERFVAQRREWHDATRHEPTTSFTYCAEPDGVSAVVCDEGRWLRAYDALRAATPDPAYRDGFVAGSRFDRAYRAVTPDPAEPRPFCPQCGYESCKHGYRPDRPAEPGLDVERLARDPNRTADLLQSALDWVEHGDFHAAARAIAALTQDETEERSDG